MATLAALRTSVTTLGKPSWRPVLAYVAELHERSIHPPQAPLPYSWEEIGPGYCYGPAFGHWDLVHAVFDVLPDEPEHARHQLLNGLVVQSANGMLPGVIWMPRADDPTREKPRWSNRLSHPLCGRSPCRSLRIIRVTTGSSREPMMPWCARFAGFETHRKAKPEALLLLGYPHIRLESGVDEGVRFDHVPAGPLACVDACSHLYALYSLADAWATRLGISGGPYGTRAHRLHASSSASTSLREPARFLPRRLERGNRTPHKLEGTVAHSRRSGNEGSGKSGDRRELAQPGPLLFSPSPGHGECHGSGL